MYELLILTTLANGPMHGYLIAKVLDHIIGPFRQAQWGALYPVLNRLEQEGLVCADLSADGDSRQRKVFAITEAGRERLHEHLMNTERHLGEYDAVFLHKVAHFHLLAPEERVYLCRHYAVYAQQNLDHLRRSRRHVVESPHLSDIERPDILTIIDHRAEYWTTERAWAEGLIAREQTKEAS